MANKFFILALSFFFVVTSCTEEEAIPPTDNSPNQTTARNTLMALGASRVEGARPEFESYRYELWKQLIDGGFEFDFVGTQNDLASYPDYNGQRFDADHEGRGGWTSGQILSEINDWLDQIDTPDIVLFSSPGGNDALEGLSYDAAVEHVNAIIDAIQASNPNVTIIIEQMAPAHSDQMTPQLSTYFTRMQQDVLSIASEQSTPSSKVLPVDMATGFNDSFLADDVHYNEAGARFIADHYYDVLVGVLRKE